MGQKPLAIDLFCGLFGWGEGLIAEGYEVVGFDLEDMRSQFGFDRLPHSQLVLQDVLTLHGSQFKDAALIVASPPCQEYSYMAMPWKRAKAKAAAIRADTAGAELERLNRLFNACLRIQFEASLAAGRHVPLIIENVKGAQPWVGRARWSFGSFYLWGDVPALMPITFKAQKVPGFRFDGSGGSFQSASVAQTGIKAGDAGWRERGPGRQLQDRAIKNNGGSWFAIAHNTTTEKGQNPGGRMDRKTTALVASEMPLQKLPRTDGQACEGLSAGSLTGRKTNGPPHIRDGEPPTRHLTNPDEHGTKVSGDWFGSYADMKAAGTVSPGRLHGKNSIKRKFASAMIAKIPLPLSRHIAATFR